eukprot:1902349-Prymnesium_polylepis.1
MHQSDADSGLDRSITAEKAELQRLMDGGSSKAELCDLNVRRLRTDPVSLPESKTPTAPPLP